MRVVIVRSILRRKKRIRRIKEIASRKEIIIIIHKRIVAIIV